MVEIQRIGVEEARRELATGRALLVCAYTNEGKCSRMKLDGSITLSELQSRLPSLPQDQELIFYCG
jgi:hypothetical protein